MGTNDHQQDTPERKFTELPRRERRRVLLRALARLIVSLVVLIGIYIIVPADRVIDDTAGVELAVGALLLAGVIAWELYRIVRDPYPEVRAGVSLLVVVAFVVIMFSLAYATMSAAQPDSFNVPIGKGDAVYFTVTTLATVGFGDITATSTAARWVVTTQMLFDLVLLVGLARVIILAAKAGRARKQHEAT
jgi:voltage-gated potassium channel